MEKPAANAVANKTDDTLAPTPAPAAAPHTMNTQKNDDTNSANTALLIKIEDWIQDFFFDLGLI